ncbi:hypothetical protein H6770_01000 [Candidatus Peribacteria bacterium]|nr:hypothetical protein [Candidatus Peribacteria bacterium]
MFSADRRLLSFKNRWVDIVGNQYQVVDVSPSETCTGIEDLVVRLHNGSERAVTPEWADKVVLLPGFWKRPTYQFVSHTPEPESLRHVRGPPPRSPVLPEFAWKYELVYDPIESVWTDREVAKGHGLIDQAGKLWEQSDRLAIIAEAKWHVHRGDERLVAWMKESDREALVVHRNTQELYGEAIHALNDGISHRVIALCDQMIRMGRFSTSVWYLRAAASLQSGDEFLARGNARLAGAEQRRHTLFERLQGPMRIYLEKMIIQEGPFVSLPPTLSPDIAFHLQHADGSHESDDLNHMEREEIEAALAGGRFEEPVFRTGIRRRLIEKDASTVYEVAQRYDVPLFPENVIYVRRLRDGAGREMVGIAVPLNGEMRFLIH